MSSVAPPPEVEAKRPREEQDTDRPVKKARDDAPPAHQDGPSATPAHLTRPPSGVPPAVSRLGLKPKVPELPPSLQFVTGKAVDLEARRGFIGEPEVGIINFAGNPDFKGVKGVIKQRFTDFLVNEISLAGNILHLHDIGKPEEPKDEEEDIQAVVPPQAAAATGQTPIDLPSNLVFDPHPQWPASVTPLLRQHFSDATIVSLHELLLDGRFPRPKQDAGWGSRQSHQAEQSTEEEMALNAQAEASSSQAGSKRQQGRDRGRGRGGGHHGNSRQIDDSREVLSQVISSKEERSAAHKAVRDLFNGLWDTTARGDEATGQRLVIKWSSRGGRQERKPRRPKLPQYIHFTLHKTNRETQDCLGHLSRMLGVHIKDLTVCGTKDKRAVTVQRVCLKRGNSTLQSVWRSVNSIKNGRRTEEAAITERGERGTRIGDLTYSSKFLELGMLKGNHFSITLRNVQAESNEEIDSAMSSIRDNGFINYFGMQRFGTSTVPTHITGLLLLQQKWGEAIDTILSLREGEHPDCVRARLAWLEDQDVSKALEIMPRRSVAERAIWTHWQKGNRTQDKVGALGSIPRNLRTIYVHAYQSYIWNLMASERIKLSNKSPIVGDLVFVDGSDDRDDDESKPDASSSRDVKHLTEADVGDYTLLDVILPLPGWNVDYPGGAIGELYRGALKADDLDADRMRRDQRWVEFTEFAGQKLTTDSEYSLPGSYRKLIHKPTNVTWDHIRYTDPDLPLVQADEDRILGLNTPVDNDPDGKFQALRLSWTLGTSSYATMALREITRQETSTWHQIGLTLENEDQEHKKEAAQE